MMPTTKIRQETMVFTYLKAYLISVGFKHIGGEAPRGPAGIWGGGCGGGGAEVSFLGSSVTSATAWESRTNRDAVALPASSRHSRTMAFILLTGTKIRSQALAHTSVQENSHLQAVMHTSSHTLLGVGPKRLGLGRK